MGVLQSEGAMQLTRTLEGAHSAARARVRPSMAPFERETEVWRGNPLWTAMEEKRSKEGEVDDDAFWR